MVDKPEQPELAPPTAPDAAQPETVEQLFREHNNSLLRFLAVRLGSQQEAREIAQEAYVRLLNLHTPGAVSYLRAFLFKTASNLAIDRLRTRRYRERTTSWEFFEKRPAATTPEQDLSGKQELQRLQRLLDELPPKCQRAFVLNKFHGMDAYAIAKEMKITDRMVRSYIVRALVHCRAGLEDSHG
jgi:RNA polymerase sigma factor (sigma-70 family)